MNGRWQNALAALIGCAFLASGCASLPGAGPVELRLQVGLTPEELADFTLALKAVDEAHPGWTVVLEPVPQLSEGERVTTHLAADTLPDVVRLQGLNVQQWIRRQAFLDLDPRIAGAALELDDFYAGPLAQFEWRDSLYGIPDTAAPELFFFNRTAFAEAGLEEPTADWTYDDMRAAALQLTRDANGLGPNDPGFNPRAIEQWGWNGGITYFWQNHFVRALGGELCASADCTLMSFDTPANRAAFEWWISLVHDEHASLYDPYGGSQTGIPGDPFLAGKAAMGTNGSFAIGQLNAAGTIDYEVLPPLLGRDGRRYTMVSTSGYVISAKTQHPDQAWELVQALTAPAFLVSTWGRPGHAVPARRAAADSIIDPSHPPANQQAVLEAMEVGEVFRPYTARAVEANSRTIELFTRMNRGELSIEEGLGLLEAIANEVLAPDRSP